MRVVKVEKDKLEAVTEFCYLWDMLSAGGGCELAAVTQCICDKSNRKAMNRNWSNQKANPALKPKTGNKYYK